MSSSFPTMRPHSVSSYSTFPDNISCASRRPSDSSACERTLSYSPEALAETIESKSIAELEALGGPVGLAHGLYTDLSAGLSSDQYQPSDLEHVETGLAHPGSFQSRKEIYGTNEVPMKEPKGFLELLLTALNDKVLLLLCVVAAISLTLGLYQTLCQPHLPEQPRIEWIDSLTIMTAVLLVVVTGAVNDYQKEKQFSRLTRKTEDRVVRAIRSGKPTQISVFDVLVGDILHVAAGSVVAADGVLLAGYSVTCDESSLTGESDQLKKLPLAAALARLSVGEVTKNLDPFMISGSKVVEGAGTYLVTGVGVDSMIGRLRMDVAKRTEATPLQRKLNSTAGKIAVAGVIVATLLFTVLTIKLVIQLGGSGRPTFEVVQNILRIFMVSISILVVAVPEGLPLAVTLALAIGVTRMLKDNNLVRDLSACETMGNATVICSDKTGTLTMNKMTVTAGQIGLEGESGDLRQVVLQNDGMSTNERRSNRISSCVTLPDHIRGPISPQVQQALVDSIAINTTALETQEDGTSTFIGSGTETALLVFSRDWLGMQSLGKQRANSRIKYMFPFDSTRKYMVTVAQLPNGTYRVYAKGAPEVLLQSCTRFLRDARQSLDRVSILTDECRQQLLGVVERYGRLSFRTIGFAYKDTSSWPPTDNSSEDDILQDAMRSMTFLATLAIHDPLRPEILDAVAQCGKAGVSVRMVTGDNMHTACAIAEESGILSPSGIAMEGPQFRKLSQAATWSVVPRLQVLARSSPEDKKLLVKRLKELGETVAVTGDGTNDGPALRTADVGFSMGLSGTDVAQDASSIVLMDDNFSSIVRAIVWGRSVNDSVKKFLHFQLTANITAVVLTFTSAIDSDVGEPILSPAQLLWINLIMDTLAALALATDPANPNVLQRAPDTKGMPLISATGWKMIFGQATYQLIIMIMLNSRGTNLMRLIQPDDIRSMETFIFNTFVWMQLFNLYNNRCLNDQMNIFKGLHRNYYFLAVSIVIVTGQVLIVTFGGKALSTVPLSIQQWIVSVTLGALGLPLAVLIRCLPVEWLDRLLNSSASLKRHKREPSSTHVSEQVNQSSSEGPVPNSLLDITRRHIAYLLHHLLRQERHVKDIEASNPATERSALLADEDPS